MKRMALALTAGTLALTLSACGLFGGKDKQVLQEMENNQNVTLKVSYWDEQSFMQKYGYMFMAKFPNIDLEVVSTRSLYMGNDGKKDFTQLLREFVEKEQLDLFMVQPDELGKLAADGLLYELDPVIAEDGYDIGSIQPAIVEYLKLKGNGKLYGLAPTFNSNALFINKDLFDKNGIEYPKDEASWADILQLAQRYPASSDKKTRVYGYSPMEYESDPFSLMRRIAHDSGLKLQSQGKATVQTPSWKRLVELVANAYKSGSVYQADMNTDSMSEEEWLLRDPFVAGRSAMSIGDTYLLSKLNQAASVLKDRKFNWEIIPAPQGIDATPGTNFTLNELFAIRAQSPNVRAAWELLKYMSGDEIARVQSKIPSTLWARTGYQKLKDGKTLDAFYQLTYNPSEAPEGEDKFAPVNYMVQEKFNAEFKEIIAGTKSVDQALTAMEKATFEQIETLKQQENKPASK